MSTGTLNTSTSMKVSGEEYCKAVGHTKPFRRFGGEEVCTNCWKTKQQIETEQQETPCEKTQD